jgi:hypothetical protein
MTQTAVEWLIDRVEDYIGLIPLDIIENAKAMEKDQMKDMYIKGSFAKMRYYDGLEYIDAEQY